jgi:DNA-binding CsgD family transcriptional regulator
MKPKSNRAFVVEQLAANGFCPTELQVEGRVIPHQSIGNVVFNLRNSGFEIVNEWGVGYYVSEETRDQLKNYKRYNRWANPTSARARLTRFGKSPFHGGDDPVSLDQSEIEVLEGAALGVTVNKMAEAAGVTYSIIEVRLAKARAKLNARNTTHAVVLAIKAGLIAP